MGDTGTMRAWQGVRMRTTEAAADPDAPTRVITLPAAWDDAASAALAALLPEDGPALLATAAEAWIRPIAVAAAERGIVTPIAEQLHALLLRRRGAPDAALWSGRAMGASAMPGFVLNLAEFFHPALGFEAEAFGEAVETAVLALTLAAPRARRIAVSLSDLAGLLAALGIAYDSDEGRLVAANIAALLRGRADSASARFARQATLISQDWRLPAACAELPELALAARAARGAIAPHHVATTAILLPGPADALLGVETGGIAPAFAPVNCAGQLTRTARAWLAAHAMSAESALARQIAGQSVFPEVSHAAHLAMVRAVAPMIQAMPALPEAHMLPVAPGRRELPARRRGYTQQTTIAGHRVLLRTAEFEDGTLGEISVGLPKESATVRGLMDGLCQAVSIGLQHGAGLGEFVEAFGQTRFAPAGTVSGDPAVARASSLLDYVVRHLAAHYAPEVSLPEGEVEAPEVQAAPPSLPLDLPAAPRQRLLRVVSG